jgi:protein-L-isoaspartate(D-aspartate) O-methyltransferase
MATARLVQELNIQPTHHVLVVAGGTGFSSAVVAGMAQHVTHTESQPSLLSQAQKNHQSQGLTHITYSALPPTQTPPGSFDAILVDAATAVVCPSWLSALAPGGRLACLLANAQGVVQGTLITQASKTMFTQTLFDTKSPLHPQLTQQPKFVF